MSGVELRGDYSSGDFRALARKSRDAKQARRLMALAGVADGLSRTEAAAVGLMDRQTLRDWVHRFNEQGPEGLIDRKSTGPKPKLTAEQRATLTEIVTAGPDRVIDGVVRLVGAASSASPSDAVFCASAAASISLSSDRSKAS